MSVALMMIHSQLVGASRPRVTASGSLPELSCVGWEVTGWLEAHIVIIMVLNRAALHSALLRVLPDLRHFCCFLRG